VAKKKQLGEIFDFLEDFAHLGITLQYMSSYQESPPFYVQSIRLYTQPEERRKRYI
jgi:hypothetical protein